MLLDSWNQLHRNNLKQFGLMTIHYKYYDEYDHLLGNGQLKPVLMSTTIQQKFPWIRVINKQVSHGNIFLESAGVSATTDTRGQNTKCSVWRPPFCSLEVIKESSFLNSRDSFVREFRRQFSSWVFNCGVLTIGQRKLTKRRTRKSEPSQSRRREDARGSVRNGASSRESWIVRYHNWL
jgi:hypothetical protein